MSLRLPDVRTPLRLLLVSLLAVPLAACGGGSGGGGGTPDGGGGGGADSGASPCGFASTDYLPYQVGNHWTYQVTDLGNGQHDTKDQSLGPEMTDPTFGDVVVQTTDKANGQTVSYLQPDGDQIIRLYQEDHDATGALQQATTYDPSELRIDESDGHLAAGAAWDQTYIRTVNDPQGTLLTQTHIVDHWEVLGVDVACDSPLGTFTCVRLHKVRTQGGVADKEYFFARGVGKVREVGGNQLEELTSCGPQ